MAPARATSSSRGIPKKRNDQRLAVAPKVDLDEAQQQLILNEVERLPSYAERLRRLRAIPGITAFLSPDLIPALLAMTQLLTDEQWQTLIAKADPKQPASIYFLSHLNDANRKTQKIREDTEMFSETSVANRRYPCPDCRCIESYFSSKQTRRADEGATLSLKCVKCGKVRIV